jgi:ATP-dependent protease HslVU (ClpYQ) ATPase subunit
MGLITRMAVERAERMGIIFIDEIYKVAGRESRRGGIQYSSGCIAMANSLSTFHVVAIRELMN